MEPSQQPTVDRPPPHQLQVIRQNIDELVSAVISSNDAAISQNQNRTAGGGSSAEHLDDASLRAHQANAIKTFKDLMIEIQRKTSKAVHEVESKLGPSMQAGHANGVADALLQDLPGVAPGSELNRALARTELHGKQSYKLRDVVTANLPSSIVVPQIVVADDGGAAMLPVLGGHEGNHHVVVLQPTLRNVWVVQHAYAKLIHHKEGLIAQYLATATAADTSNGGRAVAGGAAGSNAAGPPPPPSRKFAREYYEVLGLANLPSKDKLGNLLDIKSSTYHSDATGDVMLVLVSTSSPVGNGLTFREAVTGDVIAADNNDSSSGGGGGAHLVLPMTEASIRKLYDTYRALRAATAEQRRASKDKAFAATLPVDEVAELEMQFNFGGAGGSGVGAGAGAGGGATGGRKRRRMLDDED